MSIRSLARRFASASGFTSGRVCAAVIAALSVFLLPVAAAAYTLVLRSGRQVNVPGDFKVTPAAVIYETSPGFFVTVWLANVDTAATEKANAEPAGSFVRRIKQEPDETVPTTTPESVKAESLPARRVVTNRELEPLRLRREAQEAEYERTRRERGMPSKEELRQRIKEQDRRLRELTLQMQAERAEAEAESLRSEMFNVRRELNDLRLSQQSGAYVNVYASPSYDPYYNPYYYAPPVQFINRFPFGRRDGFARGHFGPHAPVRVWPYTPGQGLPFHTPGRPHLNGGSTPTVVTPWRPAPRP
ncbi:MAG TPA: hypothetical protein VGP08_15165 [Pyrinomonadaceae bacterium]|jgi:hypothetical protein|nr:hypothetical protein [Pyrinomonadaceae bacterium]